MKHRYAGIGSRQAPKEILDEMTNISSRLERCGFILRSGGAKGADKAFDDGVLAPKNKEIYLADDCQPWAIEMVKKYLPTDRSGFDSWKSYVKNLLGRNMMQILGKNGDVPVEFIVCWTPVLYYHNSDCGGTGYAIRCALDKNIPIFNLKDETQREKFKELMEFLEK